jgi:hypothetical protein
VQREFSIFSLALALAGCAGESARPIGADHPAHPDAPAAQPMTRSTTLELQSGLASAAGSTSPVPAASSGYACPMHPAVTSAAPGKCPVCGMALKPVAAPPATQHSGHDHGGHE